MQRALHLAEAKCRVRAAAARKARAQTRAALAKSLEPRLAAAQAAHPQAPVRVVMLAAGLLQPAGASPADMIVAVAHGLARSCFDDVFERHGVAAVPSEAKLREVAGGLRAALDAQIELTPINLAIIAKTTRTVLDGLLHFGLENTAEGVHCAQLAIRIMRMCGLTAYADQRVTRALERHSRVRLSKT